MFSDRLQDAPKSWTLPIFATCCHVRMLSNLFGFGYVITVCQIFPVKGTRWKDEKWKQGWGPMNLFVHTALWKPKVCRFSTRHFLTFGFLSWRDSILSQQNSPAWCKELPTTLHQKSLRASTAIHSRPGSSLCFVHFCAMCSLCKPRTWSVAGFVHFCHSHHPKNPGFHWSFPEHLDFKVVVLWSERTCQ